MVKRDVKICHYCRGDINIKKDKYVFQTTVTHVYKPSEDWWHYQCWTQWFSERIDERISNSSKQIYSHFQPYIEQITKNIEKLKNESQIA